jgi:uncharacterized protein
MLELRPNCECCDYNLPPGSGDAFICSFECTFCRDCATEVLQGKCPNCGGDLRLRPSRPAHLLVRAPGPVLRVVRPDGCEAEA